MHTLHHLKSSTRCTGLSHAAAVTPQQSIAADPAARYTSGGFQIRTRFWGCICGRQRCAGLVCAGCDNKAVQRQQAQAAHNQAWRTKHQPQKQRRTGLDVTWQSFPQAAVPQLSQQQQQQPDPAADDLDLLAAAAAAATVTVTAGSSSISVGSPAGLTPGPISPITSIPEARPRYALPVGKRPRYTAADKTQLSGDEMRDIGRRLRTPLRRSGAVLHVFRYGIDDLRLYKAIDMAGLEGRVVVVDTMADADVVLATYSTRTRKIVNLATAKRAAAGAGVPLLVLPGVSAQRLVDAVGPMLGLPTVEETGRAAQRMQPGAASSWYQQGQEQLRGRSQEPRMLQWHELEGDGSEELMQLMWCGENSSSNSSQQAAASGVQLGMLAAAGAGTHASVAGACCPSPRWHAWCAAQAASPALCAELFAAVRDADVEDARDGAVPSNPTARAGERYRLLKPLRPYSRIKRQKLRHDLAMRRVSW